MKGGALIAKTSLNAENYVDGAPCRTMLTMFCRPVSPSRDHNTMSCNLCLAVTNLLLEFDGGMEWRMTPIQEGDDDEDINKVDTHEPCLFAELQVVINLDSAFGSDSSDQMRSPN